MISGSGALTKLGAGTLSLTGSNSYTGVTTVSAGTLSVGDGTPAGSVAGDIVDNATLVFNRSNNLTYAGAVSGSGALTKLGAGVLSLTGSNSYSGVTTVSAGTLSIGAGSTTGSIAGDIVDNATLVFNRSDALTYAGAISGSGAVTKLGDGVLSLTGSNSYSGATTVSAGELKVNGSTGTGAMTIASAAFLSGTGTIGGATTISGTHMPGNSPGVQTFLSDLTYSQTGTSGPQVYWELAANTASNSPVAYDQIDVGGNLNFAASTAITLAFGGAVDWSNSFWATNEQWTIYQVGGTTSGFSNLLLAGSDWSDAGGNWFNALRPASSFSLLQIGNNIILNYTVAAVPEIDPSCVGSVLALVLGSLGLVERRHRRTLRPTVAA